MDAVSDCVHCNHTFHETTGLQGKQTMISMKVKFLATGDLKWNYNAYIKKKHSPLTSCYIVFISGKPAGDCILVTAEVTPTGWSGYLHRGRCDPGEKAWSFHWQVKTSGWQYHVLIQVAPRLDYKQGKAGICLTACANRFVLIKLNICLVPCAQTNTQNQLTW